jgi:hypothetical protein
MVGTLVTVGGSGVKVAVAVGAGVVAPEAQAARRKVKRRRAGLIFIEVPFGDMSPNNDS